MTGQSAELEGVASHLDILASMRSMCGMKSRLSVSMVMEKATRPKLPTRLT